MLTDECLVLLPEVCYTHGIQRLTFPAPHVDSSYKEITISSIVMQPVVVPASCLPSLGFGLVQESQQQQAERHSSPQVSPQQHFHPSRQSSWK